MYEVRSWGRERGSPREPGDGRVDIVGIEGKEGASGVDSGCSGELLG